MSFPVDEIQQVLVPAEFRLKHAKRIAWGLTCYLAVCLFAIAFVLGYLIHQAPAGSLVLILNALRDKPVDQQLLIALKSLLVIFGVAVSVYVVWRIQYCRLWVTDTQVVFESKIPLVGKWIDWTLQFNEFEAGSVKFSIVYLYPHDRFRHLTFSKKAFWMRRTILVSNWEPVSYSETSATVFGEQSKNLDIRGTLARFLTKPNLVVLQTSFESIPLILALKKRGVQIPLLKEIKARPFDVDLMGDSRLRHAFRVLLLLTLMALGLHVYSSSQYFLSDMPKANFAVPLALFAIAGWFWLAQKGARASCKVAERIEIRVAQVFVALLLSTAISWLLYAGSLSYSLFSQPAIQIEYVIDTSTKRLTPGLNVSSTYSDLQSITLRLRDEDWLRLRSGQTVSVQMRRNAILNSFQYDWIALHSTIRQSYLQ